MAVLDPQHVQELGARISDLERVIQTAGEQARALALELRKHAAENGTPPPKSLPVSTPLSTANRVLGEPEFAKVPAHAWISAAPDKILIAMFLLFLFLPLAAYLMKWESGESLQENRNLARAPAFGTDPVAKLPAIIDAYYRDYFGFRKRLIRWHDTIRYKWLRISTERVVIGKDDWAFFVAEGNLQSFIGAEPLSAAYWTNVTDAGLKHLNGLTKLFTLDLKGTKVTDAGVDALHKSLPNAGILWKKGMIEGRK